MHEQPYRVAIVTPDDAFIERIGSGLDACSVAQVGHFSYDRLAVGLHGPDGELAGGLVGATYWHWLFVEMLWVDDALRGRGYGDQLLTLAEAEARVRGCTSAFLDTFSFQAPEFYQQRGDRIFGELADFPTPHRRFFLHKTR